MKDLDDSSDSSLDTQAACMLALAENTRSGRVTPMEWADAKA
jgi:hypothetical protein